MALRRSMLRVARKNEFTNAHHTVVKNSVFIYYNIFLYQVSKKYFSAILSNKFVYITQMNNEIIKSFYA